MNTKTTPVTNYDLVAQKDVLRAKAKIMMTEGFISEKDYNRYTTLFNRLYTKVTNLVLKTDLDEVNRRLSSMLELTEAILWDVVKHSQAKDMTPVNVRKYNADMLTEDLPYEEAYGVDEHGYDVLLGA